MPTDFDKLPPGKMPLEKITRRPELFDHDELINSISQSKFNPSYQTLKLVLLCLETILVSQKQMIREIQELKRK